MFVTVVQSLSQVWLFCNLMDCSPSGFSVHGISQARILDWVAIFFSRVSSQTQGSIPYLLHCRRILYHWATREVHLSADKQLVGCSISIWQLVNGKKKIRSQVENYGAFLADKPKDLSPGHGISDSSEGLLQMGKGGVEIYMSFCNKDQVVRTSKVN